MQTHPTFLDWLESPSEPQEPLSAISLKGPAFPTPGALTVQQQYPERQHRLLWINGPAGFGKTILCASIIERLSTEAATTKSPVAFFFLSSDFESRNDPFTAIRWWISQIIATNDSAFDIARQRWLSQTDRVASRAVITKLFREVLSQVPGCTLVLDGLDECINSESASKDTVGTFIETISDAVRNTHTRVLMTSRDEPEIREGLTLTGHVSSDVHYLELKIQADNVKDDLISVSRSIVDGKLSNKSEDFRNDLSIMMASYSEGQFLWLKMQEASLRKGKNKKQLEDAISKAPAGLELIYSRNWDNILALGESERERAIGLLRWVAFALRPLKVCELTEALLINDDEDDGDDELPEDEFPDTIDDDYIESEILGLVGPLVEVRHSTTSDDALPPPSRPVHLTHFSVKEFLLKVIPPQSFSLIRNEQLRLFNETAEAAFLTKKCLRYITYPKVWQERGDDDEKRDDGLGSALRDYAGYWFRHAVLSKEPEDVLLWEKRFVEDSPECWKAWQTWYDENVESELSTEEKEQEKNEPLASPIYYAATIGLENLASYLVDAHPNDIGRIEGTARSSLTTACYNGHLKIAKQLIDSGQTTMNGTKYGWTPLYIACLNGHKDIVKLLLDNGADPDVEVRDGWTPLNATLSESYSEIATLLLERGAKVTATADNKWTALHSAALDGLADMARLLLDRGVPINSETDGGWTALQLACRNGHAKVVRTLLERGADYSTLVENTSALSLATRGSHLDVMKALLDAGANVNPVEGEIYSPLYLACCDGLADVTKLLLDRGADAQVLIPEGLTPIHIASMENHVNCIKVLLDAGVHVESPMEQGWTPLYVSVSHDKVEPCRLFLERGADPNKSPQGWTPLHSASDNGNEEIINMLLDKGADINGRSSDESTSWPLYVAVCGKDVRTATQLLDRGAKIDLRDSDGATALSQALLLGGEEMVRLLVDRGADPTAKSDRGDTMLISAASVGDLSIMKLLHKICPSLLGMRNNIGSTALFIAARYGQSQTVEWLLSDLDVDPSDPIHTDWFKSTPLFSAVRNGHAETAKLLLLHPKADFGVRDCFGRSLKRWAHRTGDQTMIALLTETYTDKGFTDKDEDEVLPEDDVVIERGNVDETWCDVCTISMPAGGQYRNCGVCFEGLEICLRCYGDGARCLDKEHEMVLKDLAVASASE